MAIIKVELDGQDELIRESADKSDPVQLSVSVIGCHHLTKKVEELKKQFGPNPENWQMPLANDHSSLLLREFILKCQGKWDYPYHDDELCHCRMVPTHTVDQAIIRGAHTPEKVSQMTSASTACGTCRADVQKILAYRLK